MATPKGFKYKPRTQEQLQKRANQSGSARDSYIQDKYKTWSPGTGKNKIRFFPPTFDGAEHYGVDCWVHYSIGPDNSAFLCLNHLDTLGYEKEDCPVCKAKVKADKNGDEELANSLKPNKRVLTWIIDRSKPQEGPLIWPMPWTLDRNITNRCVDDDNETTYNIDDPVKGNDVSFMREGKEQLTKYVNEKIITKVTPLSDDDDEQEDWIKYVLENPLTDVVVIPDVEKMEEALEGGSSSRKAKKKRAKDDDDDDDEAPRSRKRRAVDEDDEDEDEAPKSRRRRAADDDEDEAPPKKKRRVVDEDEEEEEESRPRSRRRAVEEEDEDEAPPKKKRRVVVDEEDEDEAPPKKKRRAVDEDEEEEERPARPRLKRTKDVDEDPDEDEDEDDKKSSKTTKAASRKSSSSRSKDTDDEDDDEDTARSSRRQSIREKTQSMKRR